MVTDENLAIPPTKSLTNWRMIHKKMVTDENLAKR